MSIEQNVESVCGLDVQFGLELSQSLCDNFQVPLPVISLLGGEEGQVEVPEVMEDSPTTTPPPDQRDVRLPHGCKVALGPGILMASNDHGWLVPPEQQDAALLEIDVGVDPVLQSQVLVHIGGLGV